MCGVSLCHVKTYVSELKSNKASDYVRWWPQIDAYRVYKEFGEVLLKATKYAKLPDVERKYEADGQTEVVGLCFYACFFYRSLLPHRGNMYYDVGVGSSSSGMMLVEYCCKS